VSLRTALAALALVPLVACLGGKEAKIPPLPPIVPSTSTSLVDFTQLGLPPVRSGRTTTTVVLFQPGKASLTGSVNAPEGPVPGAIVRLERLVGDAVGRADVATDAAGLWKAENLIGGRYRVRAFRPPDLAQTQPEIFYLGATENRSLVLPVAQHNGVAVVASVAPNPPVIDEPANLVVRLTTQRVDGEGVVVNTPSAGDSLELQGSGDWSVQSPNPQSTDGGGEVVWRVRCRSSGEQPLSVQVNSDQAFSLNLPACVEPPPETTTTEPPATTTTTAR
jgi:hypothetical protein